MVWYKATTLQKNVRHSVSTFFQPTRLNGVITHKTTVLNQFGVVQWTKTSALTKVLCCAGCSWNCTSVWFWLVSKYHVIWIDSGWGVVGWGIYEATLTVPLKAFLFSQNVFSLYNSFCLCYHLFPLVRRHCYVFWSASLIFLFIVSQLNNLRVVDFVYNTGSVFFLTTTVCHFPTLLHRACSGLLSGLE